MSRYPARPVVPGHVEPVPRRIRAVAAGTTVLDTCAARYLWEDPRYPHYLIPLGDLAEGALIDEGVVLDRPGGPARRHGLAAGGDLRPAAAHVFTGEAPAAVAGTVRFEWDALDAWYEEGEEVHVHPRDPYTRVDALRSDRLVRVELDGVVLAESAAPVLLFETGLPTRCYLDRWAVRFEHLEPTATVTACPYKGTTTQWWSAVVGGVRHEDVAWSYGFPTREAAPLAGLVAFDDDRVEVHLDGRSYRLRPA
jgi:uncharacterized protein (DUF427 family)